MMKQNQVQPGGQQSGGQGTLKLMNFVDQLGKFNSQSGQNHVSLWQSFVDKFFNESGSFIHVLYSTSKERTKQFEIVCAALPRYFYTVFTTDIQNIQITLDGSKENAGPAETKVTCDRAKFIYTYENQCQVCTDTFSLVTPLTDFSLGCLHRKVDSILVRLRQDGMATV